jgi:hypothetical protein
MAKKIGCSCQNFESIDGFYSLNEFENFRNHFKKKLEDGVVLEIPVKKKYGGFEEHWYQCAGCDEKWRLVYPDFPFKGIWGKVPEGDDKAVMEKL